MNNLIHLQGKLIPRSNPARGGGNKLSANTCLKVSDLIDLRKDLEIENKYWEDKNLIKDALLDVEYKRIVPKSKRINKIIFGSSHEKPYTFIRGARYEGEDKNIHHVITYYVPKNNINIAIQKLDESIKVFTNELGGQFCDGDENKLKKIKFDKYKINKTEFWNVIFDCSMINHIHHPNNDVEIGDDKVVTLYDVDDGFENLIKKLDIKYLDIIKHVDNTAVFKKEQYDELKLVAPYLITQVTDMAIYNFDDLFENQKDDYMLNKIPEPTNEPIIGVIDTGFDENVYFSKWVEKIPYDNEDIQPIPDDYIHGTQVSSIIVDGPNINPNLDDECGRFKVRHFEVAYKNRTNSNTLLRKITKIVKNNRDIKVWNLSLGSSLEINKNSISVEASVLDDLMNECGVIFVISGTNDDNGTLGKKIGAPADSINGLVVNSVKRNKQPAKYSRKGKVLSFFNKPDISYYGGDDGEEIRTCGPLGEYIVIGTSFAAPWITRKIAYLVYKLNMPIEVAKALLIDSATNWDEIDETKSIFEGFGTVPIKISDIINSKQDEIKFYIYGTADDYDTYTYNIPVPIDREKCPYIAKATLCYFPKCSRKQGVDYTNTELDFYFGRVKKDSSGKITIKTINDNTQCDENGSTLEEDARRFNRKWDNVKHIVEKSKDNARAKKVYENGNWGLSVKLKDRLGTNEDRHIPFGVVITLKEINGVNRYDEFIRQCTFNGWIVNKIDVENSNRFYVKSEEEVIFE